MVFARIIGRTVDRLVDRNERGHGIGCRVAHILAPMGLAILASMIVPACSRYRVFRAGAAGAKLASRQGMISALEGLQAEVQAGVETPMPDAMKAFGISGGFKQNMSQLFSSHPPLDVRIAA